MDEAPALQTVMSISKINSLSFILCQSYYANRLQYTLFLHMSNVANFADIISVLRAKFMWVVEIITENVAGFRQLEIKSRNQKSKNVLPLLQRISYDNLR